jgi:hypothetical protein
LWRRATAKEKGTLQKNVELKIEKDKMLLNIVA